MNNPSVRMLDHTADMGIEAQAPTCRGALEAIAKGLVMLMFGDSQVEAEVSTSLVVEAEDPVEVMVAWLNEIVYWSDQNNLVPSEIIIDGLTENSLHATISGEGFDLRRHVVERQVKSVTYHQACLIETPNGWLARVYVDL